MCQGAEARVYKGTWLDKEVVIKQRFVKKYRHPDIESHISRERMRNEARSLTRCRMAGIRAPCVYDVDFTTNEIVMEKIKDSKTVRNLVYQYVDQGKCFTAAQQGEGNELTGDMECMARKIGTVLGRLHKCHIIHGDLTTSNMLLVEPFEESDIILIDFGMSYIEEKVEDKAVDLYVLERAVLGTHPRTEKFVEILLAEYERSGGKGVKAVIKKLDEVRLRGRKKLCFG